MMALCIRYIWLHSTLVKLSGGVEENLGPISKPCQSFSICHWNVNSLSAHNFSRDSLAIACISIHRSDVIRISETFLDSDVAFDDDYLKIEGYNIVRSDQPYNSRRSGVCIYYEQSLALKMLDIKYLSECIAFQVLIAIKLCNFISLYLSPSQPTDIFYQSVDKDRL